MARKAHSERTKSLLLLSIVMLGVGLNFLGRLLNLLLGLPLYLDNVGTLLVSMAGGLVPGITVGFFSNLINGVNDPNSTYYAVISILIAAAAVICKKKRVLQRFPAMLLAVLIFALLGGLLGGVLTWLINGKSFGEGYMRNRERAMHILQEESELQEIVRLVGQDALSPADRLTMETAKMIREDFLQQNAFVDEDAYSSYAKQFRLLDLVLRYDALCREALGKSIRLNDLFVIPAREKIGRAKMADAADFAAVFDAIEAQMKKEIAEVIAGGEDA